MWYNTGEIFADGELFTVGLTVAADATGEYPVTVRYLPQDTVCLNNVLVPLSCSGGSINVAPLPSLTVGIGIAMAGDTVWVLVMLTNNPGFSGFNFTVDYDTAAATLTRISRGELLRSNSGAFSGNVESGTVLWYDTVNTMGDGVVFYLEFTLKEREEYVTFQTSLQLKDGKAKSFSNDAREPVAVNLISGDIACRVGQPLITYSSLDDARTKLILQVADADTSEETLIIAYYDRGQLIGLQMKTMLLTPGRLVMDVEDGGSLLTSSSLF